jgi:putative RecB family exonuclease
VSRYSHSKLESFDQCPKKFYFAYIERPDIAREETIEAFMGSRVHEALEWLYGQRQMERTPSKDDVISAYERAWDRQYHEGVRIVKAEFGPDDYRNVGRTALERYYDRYAPFDSGITVATELKVDIPIDEEGVYRMGGVLDRLDKVGDGVYEIHDYKTSSALPEQAKMDADRQLALYEIAVRAKWPDVREVTLVWHYLKFDAEIRSSRTAEDLAALREETLERIRRVEVCTVFDPKKTALCDWCEYRGICPEWIHLVEILELPLEELSQEDGVKLVNRYIELSDRIRELTEERDRAQADIIALSESRGLKNVYGQGHLINVWRKKTVAFPSSKDPARAEFERLLKERGVWDRVSTLSTWNLEKLFDDPATDPDLKAVLEEWSTPKEIVKLYPKRFEPHNR